MARKRQSNGMTPWMGLDAQFFVRPDAVWFVLLLPRSTNATEPSAFQARGDPSALGGFTSSPDMDTTLPSWLFCCRCAGRLPFASTSRSPRSRRHGVVLLLPSGQAAAPSYLLHPLETHLLLASCLTSTARKTKHAVARRTDWDLTLSRILDVANLSFVRHPIRCPCGRQSGANLSNHIP